jgi:hypothetical protein
LSGLFGSSRVFSVKITAVKREKATMESCHLVIYRANIDPKDDKKWDATIVYSRHFVDGR